MDKVLVLNFKDNVANVLELEGIKKGELVKINLGEEIIEVIIKENIYFGHKFAIKKINRGEGIIKYGERIGKAIKDIKKGFHVHVHNVESERGRGDLKLH